MTLVELCKLCYECGAYGGYADDYYYDVDLGVIISNCDECWVQKQIDTIEKDEE